MIPSLTTIKLAVAGVVLVLLTGMGLYIKYQSHKIDTLTTNLKTSEANNKILNTSILEQNKSIAVSNAKYEEVQKQLTEANGLNKALAKEFKVIKDELGKKPVPTTCEEAVSEMVQTSKKIGAKWKN